jgi:uncharacterized damage-inducible protein DinB
MTNKEFFIQTWQSELKKTAVAVRALPKDMSKLSYKCDEKARSAAEIIGHMLPHAESICKATHSFVAAEHTGKSYDSIEDAAIYFEKYATLLVDRLQATDNETWNKQIVEFYLNGNKLFAYPMSNMFWMMMFDIIHHRGQLSTYYRRMGVRNPQIYGPTAEDMEVMMESKL